MPASMQRTIYEFLEAASPYLIGWSFLFTLITSARIARKISRGVRQVGDNAVLTELAGLPLAVLLSVSFVRALLAMDWASMLLFLWWGPGFVATLIALLIARLRQQRIDWHPYRYVISYLCKLNYLAYMAVFFVYGIPGMIFAFSVWIINDQYEKAFLSLDADRTRRTFHDRWLPRVLYPAGLLIPYWYPALPCRLFDLVYGTGLLALWCAGLVWIRMNGRFLSLPHDPSLLRNMVYFPRLRVGAASPAGGFALVEAGIGRDPLPQEERAGDVPAWVEAIASWPVAFAQVREDSLLDQWVIAQLDPGVRVLMVASGGCTACLLATLPNVAHLHLVDPNPAQIALSRLKLHWLQTARPAERLALLGHTPMPVADRTAAVRAALQSLEIATDALGSKEAWAEPGPDHAGRYERLFAQLRKELNGWTEELAELCALHDPAEQARRVAADTSLGRALDEAFDRVMALPNLVRLFGEEATRNRCEPFSRHFARRTRHTLASLPAAENPYLAQVLLGRFPTQVVSPWLAAPLPTRLPSLVFSTMVMTQALRASGGPYDFVHLSNILDWLSPDEARTTLDLASAALRPGGVVFIRQLNSTLDIPALGRQFEWQTGQAAQLQARDRSYFYRALHLGRKR